MKRRIKHSLPKLNEYGYTLILVLMALVVLSTLGLSLMSTTNSTLKQADHERIDQSTYYIAESGIVQTKATLDSIVNDAYEKTKNEYENLSNKQKSTFDFNGRFYSIVENTLPLSTSTIDKFEENFGQAPEAKVTITRINNTAPLQYNILSVGKIGSNKRTLSQDYTVTLNANVTETKQTVTNKYSVHVSTSLSLSGSANIFGGEIATESNNINDISIPSYYTQKPKINISTPIEISLPPFPNQDFADLDQLPYQADQMVKKNESETAYVMKNHDLLINNYLTNGYELNMLKDNMKFNNINLESNYTLLINVGDSDRKILVNNLNVTNGHIAITGSGKLSIYVKNSITLGSGSTINSNYNANNLYDYSSPGDISKLKIYYSGNSKLDMGGSQKIYGSFYAQQADISIGNGAGFLGDIYTGGKNISVSGGTFVYSQLFLSPFAHFSLTGGGKIKGSIISKSFEASGGSSVTYDQTNPVEDTSTTFKIYGTANKLSIIGDIIEK